MTLVTFALLLLIGMWAYVDLAASLDGIQRAFTFLAKRIEQGLCGYIFCIGSLENGFFPARLNPVLQVGRDG